MEAPLVQLRGAHTSEAGSSCSDSPVKGSPVGSDIHVMLALRRNARQVVVADAGLDGTDMVDKLLTKRQRLASQMGHTLS
jgi:hypothetical protein